MNPQNNKFHKLNMLALGIESPPQELEDNFLMPKVGGEYPSDNALRIYVKKVRRQMIKEIANAN